MIEIAAVETKTVQVIIDEEGEGSLALLSQLLTFGECERVGEGVYFVQTETPKKLVRLAEKCDAVTRVEVI